MHDKINKHPTHSTFDAPNAIQAEESTKQEIEQTTQTRPDIELGAAVGRYDGLPEGARVGKDFLPFVGEFVKVYFLNWGAAVVG